MAVDTEKEKSQEGTLTDSMYVNGFDRDLLHPQPQDYRMSNIAKIGESFIGARMEPTTVQQEQPQQE